MNLYMAMRRVLADTFVFYFQAHVAHWNVVGDNFPQYHEYLDGLNGELFAAVDPIAEHIRALGMFTPNNLGELLTETDVDEFSTVASEPTMIFTALDASNSEVIEALGEAFRMAVAADQQGLANFLSERLDVHAKHGWMLRSILGR